MSNKHSVRVNEEEHASLLNLASPLHIHQQQTATRSGVQTPLLQHASRGLYSQTISRQQSAQSTPVAQTVNPRNIVLDHGNGQASDQSDWYDPQWSAQSNPHAHLHFIPPVPDVVHQPAHSLQRNPSRSPLHQSSAYNSNPTGGHHFEEAPPMSSHSEPEGFHPSTSSILHNNNGTTEHQNGYQSDNFPSSDHLDSAEQPPLDQLDFEHFDWDLLDQSQSDEDTSAVNTYPRDSSFQDKEESQLDVRMPAVPQDEKFLRKTSIEPPYPATEADISNSSDFRGGNVRAPAQHSQPYNHATADGINSFRARQSPLQSPFPVSSTGRAMGRAPKEQKYQASPTPKLPTGRCTCYG